MEISLHLLVCDSDSGSVWSLLPPFLFGAALMAHADKCDLLRMIAECEPHKGVGVFGIMVCTGLASE